MRIARCDDAGETLGSSGTGNLSPTSAPVRITATSTAVADSAHQTTDGSSVRRAGFAAASAMSPAANSRTTSGIQIVQTTEGLWVNAGRTTSMNPVAANSVNA